MLARGSSSPLPAIGMLAGMLLLGFAAVVLVQHTTIGDSLSAAPRKLQGFGYITTSKAPSSFDSSDSSSSGSSLEPSKSSESYSLESSDIHNIVPEIGRSLGTSMLSLTGSLCLQVIFAILYYRMVVSDILDHEMTPEAGNFEIGFLGGMKDPWVCIQGLCCPMVRLAHTNAVGGVCGFWETIACYCCCAWSTFNIGPLCLLIFFRGRLKNLMRAEDNALEDFVGTLLCPQISICQMSKVMDTSLGYQMTGPCSYKSFYGSE